MPRTAKDILKILQSNGFLIVNQKGSHIKLRNAMTGKQTILPMHCKDLPKGLEKAIIKQAGLEGKI